VPELAVYFDARGADLVRVILEPSCLPVFLLICPTFHRQTRDTSSPAWTAINSAQEAGLL
jgi:hypothetical protein